MVFSPRPLGSAAWAAPQIQPGDVTEAARAGVRVIVNNRPDHEEPGQPTSAEIEAGAEAAGLSYVHAPVSGFPDDEAIEATAAVLARGEPALLYCRSGMRSAAVWALAMRRLGRAEPEDLRAAAASAGYDLGRLPL